MGEPIGEKRGYQGHEFHLCRGGTNYGPYPYDQLVEMIVAGSVIKSDQLWCDGWPKWFPVLQVFPEMFAPPSDPLEHLAAACAEHDADPRMKAWQERKKNLEKYTQPGDEFLHGPYNLALICPHCQNRGLVRTRQITQKRGVSGGKATAAILTSGLSVLATGLSRKENATEAYCAKCRSIWHF